MEKMTLKNGGKNGQMEYRTGFGGERMIDTDKYEGHTPAPWILSEEYAYELFVYAGDVRLAKMDGNAPLHTNEHGNPEDVNAQLIADAPKLLAEVKRLQYLEKYAPTFQVFAQNEEDFMEEKYTQHGSLKECEEYIAALEDGWIGRIEVIEYYVPTNNPQVKTLEEWRNEE